MTISMTAFSRSEKEIANCHLVWEIRSVNHRYLDVHLKLPEDFRVLETKCRELINARLGRGRVDAILRCENYHDQNVELTINTGQLEAINDAIAKVTEVVPLAKQVNVLDVLSWPGVLNKSEVNVDERLDEVLEVLSTGLDSLVQARKREGQRLGEVINNRIEACDAMVSELRQQLPDIEVSLKQRWQQRLEEVGDNVDEGRMAQELALILTKTDIHEELDRLETHFSEVKRTLGAPKPAGRRLDFLMQELNREANTLGSKSADLRTTNTSVELKVLIDQMREQVQNIE